MKKIIACLLIISCGGEEPSVKLDAEVEGDVIKYVPYCGDGACNKKHGETSGNCGQDCGFHYEQNVTSSAGHGDTMIKIIPKPGDGWTDPVPFEGR